MEAKELIQPFFWDGGQSEQLEIPAGLSEDITHCIKYIGAELTEIKLFIEGTEKIYIFSPSILMVATRSIPRVSVVDPDKPFFKIGKTTRIRQIKFYPLKKTEYCEFNIKELSGLVCGAELKFIIDCKLFTLIFSDSNIETMPEIFDGILDMILPHLSNIQDKDKMNQSA